MRYKLLGRSGVRVSELCLGTMTFGDDWGWGATKDVSRQMFDLYVEAGGNFIDTSNNYTNGTSEKFIGEFVGSDRDQFVIATKYSLTEDRQNPNAGGNSRKNMRRSVEGSLKRLNTDFIDLLYLHMWDSTTPVEEVLRAADDLIRQGKVLYFAFSDTPAWVISYAVALAETHGWTRPVAVQIPYSLAGRAPEREIIPMAKALDLAVLPWGILEAGGLTGKYNKPGSEPRREDNMPDNIKEMAEVVMSIADEIGQSASQVAINWVRQQNANMIPIIGARSEKHMRDNLGCVDFALTDEQMKRLSDASQFKVGFPISFLTSENVLSLVHGETYARLDNHRA